jgi:hypothetical protein
MPGSTLNPNGRPATGASLEAYTRGALIARLKAHDYDPINEMIAIARDPATPNTLRFEVAKEVASYLIPKRKSVIIGDEDDANGGNTIKISWETSDKDAAQTLENAVETVIDAVVTDDGDAR